MSKKYILLPYLLCVLCLWCQVAYVYGQEIDQDGVAVSVTTFERQQDSLRISLVFRVDKLGLASHEQRILTPALKHDQDVVLLPPLIINGTTRHKVYVRSQAFGDDPEYPDNTRVLSVTDKLTQEPIPYTMAVPFETWMTVAELYLQQSGCQGCGAATDDISEQLLASMPVAELVVVQSSVQLRPLVTFVMPEGNYSRKRSDTESAYIKFPSASAQINPRFQNNAAELRKVHNVIEGFISDTHISISGIKVQGVASIEGPAITNRDLSRNRARSFTTYLQDRYSSLPRSIFSTTWVGEDWDGLRAMVEKGNMPQKRAVLAIINSGDTPDGREQRLMALDRGRAYRFMTNTYFPRLRRVDYTIEYTVDSFNVTERLMVLKEHPSYLNPKELYMMAEQYDRLSDEFKEIMDISVSAYPADLVVNNNAAAAYIIRTKLNVAEHYLMSAGNSAATFNNRGVIMMMKGQYGDARELFIKAKGLGSRDAEHNLKELDKVGQGSTPAPATTRK